MGSGNYKEEIKTMTVFKISTLTPYPQEDILRLMSVTGLKTHEAYMLLIQLNRSGISNLNDTIILSIHGYCKFPPIV